MGGAAVHRPIARFSRLSLAIASLAIAGFSACSSQNNDRIDSGGTGAGGAGSGGSGSGGSGESVLPADTGYLIWRDYGGGFILSPPPGAACPYMALYELDFQRRGMVWNVCTGNDPVNLTSYVLKGAGRDLTPDEFTQAVAAARAVTLSDRTICGADKPTLTLEIGAASTGTVVYGDDFYACQMMYEHYVVSDQLDQLGTVLRGMAHD
jgi:hypothetical protein